MFQFAGGISHNKKAGSVALGGKFRESISVEHYWSKAFHTGVARTSYHRFAAALKNRHAKIAIVVNGKPITVRTLHCKKILHS